MGESLAPTARASTRAYGREPITPRASAGPISATSGARAQARKDGVAMERKRTLAAVARPRQLTPTLKPRRAAKTRITPLQASATLETLIGRQDRPRPLLAIATKRHWRPAPISSSIKPTAPALWRRVWPKFCESLTPIGQKYRARPSIGVCHSKRPRSAARKEIPSTTRDVPCPKMPS